MAFGGLQLKPTSGCKKRVTACPDRNSRKTVVSLQNTLPNLLQLPILVRPLLRNGDLFLLRVRDLLARLDPAAHHHAAEPVFQKIALGLEQTEGVFEFVGEDDFEGGFGDALRRSVGCS